MADAAAELALLERRGTLLYERLVPPQAAIGVFQRIQDAGAEERARHPGAARDLRAGR